jgi:uncharacterized membrane protein YdfJ with MMPL/SSD domain
MIVLIAALTFLLLARAFRSLLLPLKAVLLNTISVAAAWGVITLIWQQGHGSQAIFGVPATHSVSAWIPLMVFAFLFGLSMDYECSSSLECARNTTTAAPPTPPSCAASGPPVDSSPAPH